MRRLGRFVWLCLVISAGNPAAAAHRESARFLGIGLSVAQAGNATGGIQRDAATPPATRQPGSAAEPLQFLSHTEVASGHDKTWSPRGALGSVVGGLAIVLGLFFLAAWLLRKSMPKRPATLPKDILEVVGVAPLGMRQHAQLVRLGNRFLLLAVNPSGVDTLAEITEPEEVDRLRGQCLQLRADSSTQAFRQVFSQFSRGRMNSLATREETDGLD